MNPRHWKNLNALVPAFAILGVMFGLVAYAPELYRVFCGATGYGGTTQRAYSDPATTSDRTVDVAFDANVAPDLPWRFAPEQRSVTVHLGEQKMVFFTAENLSNESIVAHATFNVTPETSGLYFNKIQCFCFNEERLDPHEKVQMPVVFFVDPAFAKDSDNDKVDTITLSYTLLRSVNPSQSKNLARFLPNAPPDPVHGKQLFAERCTMDSPNLDYAIRFKNNAMRGGLLEGFHYRDIAVGEVKRAVIACDFNYEEGARGAFTPVLRDVTIERIAARRSVMALDAQGLPNAPIERVRLSDCAFDGVTSASRIAYTNGLVLDRVRVDGAPVTHL